MKKETEQQPVKEPIITLLFRVEEVNLILKGLSELPAKESMDLILKITREAQEQLTPKRDDTDIED